MSKLQKIYYPAIAAGYTLLPLITLAQDKTTIQTIFGNIKDILNLIIGILFVLATVVFLWGVVQFIASAGNEEARKKAKGIMTWGLVGLAVMAAAWGVANILINFFGAKGTPGFVEPPQFIK